MTPVITPRQSSVAVAAARSCRGKRVSKRWPPQQWRSPAISATLPAGACQGSSSAMHEAKSLALLEWLVRSGLSGAGEAQLVSGFCEELVRLGIPLVRVSVASDLLDPI